MASTNKGKRRKIGRRCDACGAFAFSLILLTIAGTAGATLARKTIRETYGAELQTAAEIETGGIDEDITIQAAANYEMPIAGAVTIVEVIPRDPDFIPLPVNMPIEDQKIVFDIATENEIGFAFVMAIIGHETEFTKDARSATGDSGYMQINDCNLVAMEERGFVDMYDTAQNIGAGVSMLRDLFDAYGDAEPHRVLMAYNMGSRRASELWAQGIASSEYSREVLEREAEYSAYIDAQK